MSSILTDLMHSVMAPGYSHGPLTTRHPKTQWASVPLHVEISLMQIFQLCWDIICICWEICNRHYCRSLPLMLWASQCNIFFYMWNLDIWTYVFWGKWTLNDGNIIYTFEKCVPLLQHLLPTVISGIPFRYILTQQGWIPSVVNLRLGIHF